MRTDYFRKHSLQGTMPDARRRGRPRTVWVYNIKTWTGLPADESIRVTEDRDKWKKYVHGGWLGSRVVSVLDSGAEGPGFKSQSRRCRVTVLGKLFTPIVPLLTKQQIW